MYSTPLLYMTIHVFLGHCSYEAPGLWTWIILYNLVQLYMNKRLFLFSWKTESGNSLGYTVYKLAQYGFGWCIAASRD